MICKNAKKEPQNNIATLGQNINAQQKNGVRPFCDNRCKASLQLLLISPKGVLFSRQPDMGCSTSVVTGLRYKIIHKDQ